MTYLKNTKFLRLVLYCINNKSVNDDIFDDIIDYDKRTMMNIYIKSSNVCYVGRFAFREENGINSWIVLAEYYSMNRDTGDTILDLEEAGMLTSVAIKIKDIERIELIYEKDSEVWKRLKG